MKKQKAITSIIQSIIKEEIEKFQKKTLLESEFNENVDIDWRKRENGELVTVLKRMIENYVSGAWSGSELLYYIETWGADNNFDDSIDTATGGRMIGSETSQWIDRPKATYDRYGNKINN